MSAISASFKPSLDNIQRQFQKIGEKLNKTELANKKCAIVLDQWVLENFKTEGKKVGGWQPFKYPEWGRYKKGIGWDPSAKLLQDTGRLRRSYRPFSNRITAGIGSKLPYSKYHEKGEGHLPQRRMLPRSDKDTELMDKFYEIYNKHVETAIK